jgi:hypothetical protein
MFNQLFVVVAFENAIFRKSLGFIGCPVALGLLDHILAPGVTADFGSAAGHIENKNQPKRRNSYSFQG